MIEDSPRLLGPEQPIGSTLVILGCDRLGRRLLDAGSKGRHNLGMPQHIVQFGELLAHGNSEGGGDGGG
jgi:hypothetical protein